MCNIRSGSIEHAQLCSLRYAEKTPLIVISGGPGEREKVKGDFLHHTVKGFNSQLKIYKEVTEETVLLDSPKTAYVKIQKALNACQEFMRPVYIEIPRDMVDEVILIPEEKKTFFYPLNENAVKEAADEIHLKWIS